MSSRYEGPSPDLNASLNQTSNDVSASTPGASWSEQPFTYREFVPVPPSPPGYQPPPQQGPPYPPPYGAAQQLPPLQQRPPYPPPGGHPPPYQGYPYPGYQPGYYYNGYNYNGYNGYPPPGWQPVPQPKQDGYRLGVIITGLACAVLATLGGLASAIFLLIDIALPNYTASDTQYFSEVTLFTALALAGIIGGGFSIYHCIRALVKKPSASMKLPWFWLFLVMYVFVIGVSYALRANDLALTYLPLTIFLVSLLAIFPALSLLALGLRRLRFPAWRLSSGERWPTNWRRFTLAITSGATLGTGLAILLELGALLLVIIGARQAGTPINYLQCINNPGAPGCGTFFGFDFVFLIVAVIAPIIEETVKPLGVALFIGRIRSASEAFILGVSAGIGFALVETVGYIASGGPDWLPVALERTGASLLHGFGAGMAALGWYYLIHSKKRPLIQTSNDASASTLRVSWSEKHRILKGLSFWGYAVFQHFVWNGTAVLALLPDPYGTTLNSWNLNLGFVSLPFVEVLNIIEALLILTFFVYMAGRLRSTTPPATPSAERRTGPAPEPAVVTGT